MELPVSDFYYIRGNPCGDCKSCKKTANQQRSKTEDFSKRKSESSRKHHLKKTYGITPEQYNEILAKQEYCCAICGKHEEDEKNRRLAVDHNHETGEIRGLLCSFCNHRVVGRHRDGDLLRKVADYIEQGTGWFVPKKKRPVKRKPK
jgi:hypothetical protein